jgi:hypothetical protein
VQVKSSLCGDAAQSHQLGVGTGDVQDEFEGKVTFNSQPRPEAHAFAQQSIILSPYEAQSAHTTSLHRNQYEIL